jgi:hypothetical protein
MRVTALAWGLAFLAGIGPAWGSPLSPEPDSFFRFLTPALPASDQATLSRFPGFTEGPATGKPITVLFLPGCPHCFALWQAITLLRETNPAVARLRFRWVPLTVTTAQAAALAPYWQGPRDGKALAALMQSESRTSSASTVPAAKVQAVLTATRPALRWLRRTGAQVAPALVGPGPHGSLELHIGDATAVQLLRWLGLAAKTDYAH